VPWSVTVEPWNRSGAIPYEGVGRKMTLGQVFLRVLLLRPVDIILAVLGIYSIADVVQYNISS